MPEVHIRYARAMAWNEKHSFRDCPWCGLRNTRLTVATTDQEFSTRTGAGRYWATLGCPSCGGAVLVEHSNPTDPSDSAFQVVPKGEAEATGYDESTWPQDRRVEFEWQ